MAYILHIDTSSDTGLIAVSSNGTLVSSIVNEETRNHAANINHDIDKALAQARITFDNIDAIAVCAGPGSYTGLRIGLSTAKGICYTKGMPLMMHNRLTLMAYSIKMNSVTKSNLVAILPAREKEYYIAIYANNFEEKLPPQHILEENLLSNLNNINDISLIGSLSTEIESKIKAKVNITFPDINIDIESWSAYAHQQYECNEFVNLGNSEPQYLKKVYTHKPKNSK